MQLNRIASITLAALACACQGQRSDSASTSADTQSAITTQKGPSTSAGTTSTQSVLVVNTSAQPVPTASTGTTTVAGTVNAAQSGAWNVGAAQSGAWNVGAAQSGTWNVGITGTPTVTLSNPSLAVAGNVAITNTPSAPVPTRSTDEHARQPYQGQFYLQISNGSQQGQDSSFVVPTGKRLVIERINAYILLPTDQLPQVTVNTSLSPGNGAELFAKPTKLGAWSSTADVWTADTSGPLYADAGTQMVLAFVRNLSANPASAFINVSGYLINP